MIANHIHDALAQVRDLQRAVLNKQRFKGYSGRARAMGGNVALLGAGLMSLPAYPTRPLAHFAGWGLVCIFALLFNYGSMIYWYLTDSETNRDWRRLKPAFEVIPPMLVGGVLTWVMKIQGNYEPLFGTWMMLFGLANLSSRHVLPRPIIFVGFYYILAGTICLFTPGCTFTNPWPMGVVFFIGEWMGGYILHYDHIPLRNYLQFITGAPKGDDS